MALKRDKEFVVQRSSGAEASLWREARGCGTAQRIGRLVESLKACVPELADAGAKVASLEGVSCGQEGISASPRSWADEKDKRLKSGGCSCVGLRRDIEGAETRRAGSGHSAESGVLLGRRVMSYFLGRSWMPECGGVR